MFDDLRSLGILGGTFNPPHVGHLALAEHALRELSLERVVLMPAHAPPHKQTDEDPGPEHRLSMCRLATAGAEGVGVCAFEIERRGPSYTVDTLRHIRAIRPDAELTFILGADTATTLPSWREPRELLGLAGLAVAVRAGSSREGVLDTIARLDGSARVRFLEMGPIDVSSSTARQRVARGVSVDELVGVEVAGYIGAHGLYASADATAFQGGTRR